jgi:DNA-directed RNA polymerase subunit omega
MAYIPLEKLVRKDTSVFKLILAAAARANELAQGAQPLIQTTSKKVSTIALEEIAAGKVSYKEVKKAAKKSESKG